MYINYTVFCQPMDKKIRILALKNAVKFDGKANSGSIMGGLFADDPELKKNAKDLAIKVQDILKQVNAMTLENQAEMLEKLAPETFQKDEKKKRELPPLDNVNGTVVTRIPPEPSKYPHIGHAVSFLINYMYAKKYGGKCILRLDDTNPEKAKKEYYQAIYDGLLWLNVKVDDTVIASKHMETFYDYAEKLIENEKVYVCFCDREKMSHLRNNAMICDHRRQNERQTREHWNKMIKGQYKVGECVLRLKADMESMNSVMRDPVLFRISEHEHPMQGLKYKVWPMYDFETAVAESITGVTHIFRSNEFGKMRIELQDYIKRHLKLPSQEVKQYGRFNIQGKVTKGREIREMMEKGEVDGWDDPRLVTLLSIKRRGIVPQTLYDLAIDVGLSPNEKQLDWSIIAALNRKNIDDSTPRFFFVKNPHRIQLHNDFEYFEVPNHPSNKDLGSRKVMSSQTYFVQDEILNNIDYRLMHLFNFKGNKVISKSYDPNLKAKIIHGVPALDAVDVTVLMDDGSVISGKGEKALQELEKGTIVQFERMFFARLDDKDKMQFVYAHD
jgi:glutamyl-tRNA synthetase